MNPLAELHFKKGYFANTILYAHPYYYIGLVNLETQRSIFDTKSYFSVLEVKKVGSSLRIIEKHNEDDFEGNV